MRALSSFFLATRLGVIGSVFFLNLCGVRAVSSLVNMNCEIYFSVSLFSAASSLSTLCYYDDGAAVRLC